LLHFGSSRCDPPRPTLSAVLVTPDRPPRSQIEVQRQDQDFSTLAISSSRPCTRNPVQHVSWAPTYGTRCETWLPRLSFPPPAQAVGRPSNPHDGQDCQATQTLLSRVRSHHPAADALQQVILYLHDFTSVPGLTMIKPTWSVSPRPEPGAMEDARNVPSRSARLQIIPGRHVFTQGTGGSVPHRQRKRSIG
jgi:hypothetical protein